ncbi:MAG: ATP-binding protein [Myxococcota bacterium]
MSPLAFLSAMWAAIHLYAACFNLLAFLKRPAEREYRDFALILVGFGIYCLGAAARDRAVDTAEAAVAAKFFFVGSALVIYALPSFLSRLRQEPPHRLARLAKGWAMVGLIGALAGAFIDTVPVRPARPIPFFPDGRYHVPELTPYAVGWGIVAMILVAGAATILLRGKSPRYYKTLLGFSAGLLVAAGTHDVIANRTFQGLFYLTEHATLAVTTFISLLLMRRGMLLGSELRARTVELSRSYEDLHHLQGELIDKEQLAAVGELSAVIAHEIRNPLAILRNAVAGLRRKELTPSDQDTLLRILDEETTRLNRLVADLVVYGKKPQRGRPVDAAELLDRAIIEATAIAGKDDIEVALDLQPSLPLIRGDAELLQRAFGNIITNALQAIPISGKVSVGVRTVQHQNHRWVRVSVHDTGEGMDSLVREKALHPFFTTRPTGTGLGLALVDRVVRSHGGTIEIDSSHGGGTRVALTLPSV